MGVSRSESPAGQTDCGWARAARGARRRTGRTTRRVLTEYKTLEGVKGQTADKLSVAIANRVMNGRGQAANIVVDARPQPNVTLEIAERGINRAYGAIMQRVE